MKKRIYSSGPSITSKEIEYVKDAIKTGWYSKYNDYVELFEKKFAEYVGLKYAIATTNGTASLHLATSVLDLKENDEVILPDISWVASADVIAYTGATPVFVDVDKKTWTISPSSIKKAITKKTRAIMPVHLYGMVSEMDLIMTIAKKNNLFVIEDAAPAVGSTFKEKKAGSFGDIGCYSFQGSKLLATGEGGMFVTNNLQLYERARLLSEHGRDDKEKTFWCSNIGYQYTMANLLAALGVAQLERIDELIAKKRMIFSIYKREFLDIKEIIFQTEGKYVKSNFSYPSILIKPVNGIDRDDLIKELRKMNIDTRPAFPCMSEFPHYNGANNPIAKVIDKHGLNLPSGQIMAEDDVRCVSKTIKEILFQ